MLTQYQPVTVCREVCVRVCVCKPKSTTVTGLKAANITSMAPTVKTVLSFYSWEDAIDNRNVVNSETQMEISLYVSLNICIHPHSTCLHSMYNNWTQRLHSQPRVTGLSFLAVFRKEKKTLSQFCLLLVMWAWESHLTSLYFSFCFLLGLNFLTSQSFGSVSKGHVFMSVSKCLKQFPPTSARGFVVFVVLLEKPPYPKLTSFLEKWIRRKRAPIIT